MINLESTKITEQTVEATKDLRLGDRVEPEEDEPDTGEYLPAGGSGASEHLNSTRKRRDDLDRMGRDCLRSVAAGAPCWRKQKTSVCCCQITDTGVGTGEATGEQKIWTPSLLILPFWQCAGGREGIRAGKRNARVPFGDVARGWAARLSRLICASPKS